MNKIFTGASIFLFILGLVLLFYKIDLGILSIVISIIIFVVDHFLQKKSDENRHEEYIHLALLIHESTEANKKIESLKKLMEQKNISIKKIIDKFDKPLYSIFIYKFNEVPRGSPKNFPKLLTNIIETNLKFQRIGNSFYMLLPRDMPKIDTKFDVEKWTSESIISKLPKSTPYTLNFVALVDLKKLFCYKTIEWGNTVFDVLTKDTTFLSKLLESLSKEKIALKEIIKDYSLGDILTIKVEKRLIKNLNDNEKTILSSLNCNEIMELCDVPKENLKLELSKYLDSNVPEITDNIIGNSKALRDVC